MHFPEHFVAQFSDEVFERENWPCGLVLARKRKLDAKHAASIHQGNAKLPASAREVLEDEKRTLATVGLEPTEVLVAPLPGREHGGASLAEAAAINLFTAECVKHLTEKGNRKETPREEKSRDEKIKDAASPYGFGKNMWTFPFVWLDLFDLEVVRSAQRTTQQSKKGGKSGKAVGREKSIISGSASTSSQSEEQAVVDHDESRFYALSKKLDRTLLSKYFQKKGTKKLVELLIFYHSGPPVIKNSLVFALNLNLPKLWGDGAVTQAVMRQRRLTLETGRWTIHGDYRTLHPDQYSTITWTTQSRLAAEFEHFHPSIRILPAVTPKTDIAWLRAQTGNHAERAYPSNQVPDLGAVLSGAESKDNADIVNGLSSFLDSASLHAQHLTAFSPRQFMLERFQQHLVRDLPTRRPVPGLLVALGPHFNADNFLDLRRDALPVAVRLDFAMESRLGLIKGPPEDASDAGATARLRDADALQQELHKSADFLRGAALFGLNSDVVTSAEASGPQGSAAAAAAAQLDTGSDSKSTPASGILVSLLNSIDRWSDFSLDDTSLWKNNFWGLYVTVKRLEVPPLFAQRVSQFLRTLVPMIADQIRTSDILFSVPGEFDSKILTIPMGCDPAAKQKLITVICNNLTPSVDTDLAGPWADVVTQFRRVKNIDSIAPSLDREDFYPGHVMDWKYYSAFGVKHRLLLDLEDLQEALQKIVVKSWQAHKLDDAYLKIWSMGANLSGEQNRRLRESLVSSL